MIEDRPRRFKNYLSDVSPQHYAKWNIEPISFISHNNLAFLEGNVIKYVMRHRDKNGQEDLLKARRYINIMLEHYYDYKESDE